jgi:transcriptional regulator with PAS, ATPase and Fis domain
MERELKGFAPEVLRAFLDYEWRGNVRELEKTVKRMVVLAEDGDTLGVELLPPDMREHAAPLREGTASKSLRSNVSMLERRMIEEALDRNRWNKARVARELGLSYPTLLAKIRTFKLERRRTD